MSAPFMLIGDGGSQEDLNLGYSIVGNSEITLKQIFNDHAKIGEGWRTLLIKDRINATDYDAYKDMYDNRYREIFLEEVKTVKPNLLIPMGELGLRVLTGHQNIRKFRGSVMWSDPGSGILDPIKVLPILGPNPYLNQEYTQRWVTQIDLAKIHRFFDKAPPPELDLNIWVCRTANAFRNFLTRQYKEDGLLVFDIETIMGMPTCISFCFDGYESVCIPFLDKTIDVENRMLMIQMVAKVLNGPIKKVNQNIKYDWKCLQRFNMPVSNIVGDTALNSNLLNPEFPKNLGFLNSIYTDIPYFKDEGREFDPLKHKKEQYFLYNAKDSLATYRIYKTQEEEIKQLNLSFVASKMNLLMPIYKKMEDNGLRFDDQKRLFLVAKYESLLSIQLLKLRHISGNPTFNPNSPPQCKTLIFDELGYEMGRYVKDTGEEALEWLIVFANPKRTTLEKGRQILHTIINVRKIKKVLEYLDTIPYPDGVVRCEYNLSGTKTGRTTAGKTTDRIFAWEEMKTMRKMVEINMGRSFQTYAKHGFMIDGVEYGKDIRSMYIPRKGYKYVEIDLSQAEARVDTVLAGNFELLKVFDGPVGIHRLTGSWVFKCDPSEIKKNTIVLDPLTGIAVDRYHMAKTVRHAGERNMKEDRLVSMTQQPREVCAQILREFHDNQKEIQGTFHHDVKHCIDTTRTLVSPNGRRRFFMGRLDHKTYNDAISQLPQSIVADQLKFAFIPVFDRFDDFAFLINEAHDGALAEVMNDYVMPYAEFFKKSVETEIDFNQCSLKRDFRLVIPSEVSVSEESWYDIKEIKM